MSTENSLATADIAVLLQDVPRIRTQLLPALWRVFEKHQQLTPEIIGAVSQILDIPYAEVYGVASFYTLFDNPGGKNPMHVCTDVMCAIQGSGKLLKAAQGAAEGMPVSVKESPCLGQCDFAPAAFTGNQVLRNATVDSVETAIKDMRHE